MNNVMEEIHMEKRGIAYHQRSIMVAEDDPDDRFLIKSAFEEVVPNLVTYFVTNGEELLNWLNQAHKSSSTPLPALIILDLNMPKISGHQALQEIKEKSEFSSIRIVVLTTSANDEDIAFCKNNGVQSFFTKPDNFDDLLQIIRSIINQQGLIDSKQADALKFPFS